MNIQKPSYERVYLSGIHKWVTDNSYNIREFIRSIHRELNAPVCFDIRMIDLITQYEARLSNTSQLEALEQLVKQLIAIKFLPKVRGSKLSASLSPLPQRLKQVIESNAIGSKSNHEWQLVLCEQVPIFCEKLIRYRIVGPEVDRFWGILQKANLIPESLMERMGNYIADTNETLNQVLADISRSRSIENSRRSEEIIQEVEYFRELFKEYSEEYGQPLEIELFGSAVNGFGLDSSDLDMILIPKNFSLDNQAPLTKLFYKILEFLEGKLPKCYKIENKVPTKLRLIQISKRLTNNMQLDIDILVGKKHGKANTEMQLSYSQLDPRVRQMGILLKLWGKQSEFIKKCKMTSYATVMMLLYYLIQRGIVGELQVHNEECFQIGSLLKKNFSMLKELKGFFAYYSLSGKFHQSNKMPRISLDSNQLSNFKHHEMLFEIVDPFETDRNLCKVKRHEEYLMNSSFQKALHTLLSNNSTAITELFDERAREASQ